MRGLLLFLAVLVLAAPLCAETTLELWDFPRIKDPADPYDRFAWLRKIARAFEEQHPGTKVSITELTWRSGEEKLKIAAFAGMPPDVTSGPLPARFVETGLVEPVDDALTPEDRADYLPAALEAYRWRGQTWGFPWCMTGACMYLNLDLFAKAGVTPPANGHWTFEEFAASMKRLTAGDARGYAFCFEPGRTVELGLIGCAGGWPLADLETQPKSAVDSAEFQSGVGFLVDLVRQGVAPAESGGFKESDVWQGFLERQAYACVGLGIWAVEPLSTKAKFKFGLAHFPNRAGQPPKPVNNVSGYFVMRRPVDAGRRKLALELARFITNAENQKVLGLYKQFPTRRATGDLYATNPYMHAAQEIVSTGRPPPAHPAWPRIDAELVQGLQPIALGSVPVAEGCKDLSGRVDAVLTLQRSAAKAAKVAPAQPSSVDGTLLYAGLAVLGVMALAALLATRAAPKSQLGNAVMFLGPGLSIFALFFLIPALRGMLFSFQEVTPDPPLLGNWAGLENFRRALADPHLKPALINTLIYTAIVVPGNIFLALVLASLIQPLSGRARTFFKAAFYLPGVASVVVLAMVWRWLYDVNFGLINRVLGHPSMDGPYQLVANGLAIASHLGVAVFRVGVIVVPVILLHIAAKALARRTGDPGAEGRVEEAFNKVWPLAALVSVLAVLWLVPFAPQPRKPVRWITSEELSLFSVILSTLVRGPGGALIVYLAAMASIPKELYEVAKIDGAGPIRAWWEVTVPLLRPTTLYLAITQLVDSFQVFAQVLMLTDGGPGDSSVVLVHRIYTSAFRDLDFGAASALAFLLFLVLATFSALQFRMFRGAWES